MNEPPTTVTRTGGRPRPCPCDPWGRSANPRRYDGRAALKLIEATVAAVEGRDEVTI